MTLTPPPFASDSGGGDTALVLLHGFGAFHGVWDETICRLGGAIRTIAYDLPGHGGSLSLPGTRPSASAGLIAADIRQRGVTHVHLAGHSMGGAIATLIALSAPEPVASLTLLSPGGFGEVINGPLLRRYAEAATPGDIRTCLAAMSAPDFDLPEQAVEALQQMRMIPGQTASLVEIAGMITRGDRQGEIPRDAICGLPMPVRIVWGDADPVLPFAQSAGLPPRFEIRRAAGAGHMLIEERPDEVIDLLAAATGALRPADS